MYSFHFYSTRTKIMIYFLFIQHLFLITGARGDTGYFADAPVVMRLAELKGRTAEVTATATRRSMSSRKSFWGRWGITVTRRKRLSTRINRDNCWCRGKTPNKFCGLTFQASRTFWLVLHITSKETTEVRYLFIKVCSVINFWSSLKEI